jgi:hypothetical protein
MVTRKTKRKFIGDSLPAGTSLGTNSVKIYVKNQAVFEEIQQTMVPSDAKSESVGQGVFKYVGFMWENGKIFAGYCATLNSGIIIFSGDDATKNFENFRKIYLSKSKPEFLNALNFRTTVSCVIPLKDAWNATDIPAKFERIIGLQEKKQPKFAQTKDGLQIGSKSTDNYITIVPLPSSNDVVTKVQLIAKITKPSSIYTFFLNNFETALEDLLASILIEFISNLTLGGFLLEIKTALIENHKIGKIQEQKATAVLSKDGKTMQRSLTTVRNKLIATATANEAKQIFLSWLTEIEILFKNDENFKQKLSTFNKSVAQLPKESASTTPGEPPAEDTSAGGPPPRRSRQS